jgi:predicted Zn finger-like uncharacterized protein
MIVECPHCGAKYPAEEEQSPGGPKLRGQCKNCNSRFIIWAPADVPQLPAEQTVAVTVVDGPNRGLFFQLRKPRTILGRSGADIVICDPEVSRKHCVIEVYGSTATLTDLDTTNGTFVEGKRIQSCQLKHLSKFRIGATTLLFTATDKRVSESDATLVVRPARLNKV